MRWRSLLGLMVFCASAQALEIVERDFAVGIEVGTIVAVSLQKNITTYSAVIGGIGTEGKDGVLYADFLYYPGRLGSIDLFFGPGGAIEFDKEDGEDEFEGLVRAVFGGAYHWPERPRGVYAKLAPSVDTDGDVELHFQAGLQFFF